MKRTLTLTDTTFDTSIRMVVGGSFDEAVAAGGKHLGGEIDFDGDSGEAYGFCANGGRTSFVWLARYPEHKGQEGAMVHELNHAVDGLLRHLGIKDDEAKSYFFQHYYRQARKKLSKK